MNLKQLFNTALTLTVIIGVVSVSRGQSTYEKKINVTKGAHVFATVSLADITVETWDKNYVEVSAQITGDYSEEEKEKMIKSWGIEASGDQNQVIISASPRQYKGEFIVKKGWDTIVELSELNIPPPPPMPSIPRIPELPNMDFVGVQIPEVPEFEKMPRWPFSDDDISIKMGSEHIIVSESKSKRKDNIHIVSGEYPAKYEFDRPEYNKDKKAYVDLLNKKFGTNVSVKDVDRWLDKLEKWKVDLETNMEEWGDKFAVEMEANFGPEFEAKMEKWGKEFGDKFGKEMEKWGEEFGEKFGEAFGEKMEDWGSKVEKHAEKWAEKYEKELAPKIKEIEERVKERAEAQKERMVWIEKQQLDRQESLEQRRIAKDKYRDAKQKRSFFIRRVAESKPSNKKIVIRVPKSANLEMDVRYGTLNLVEVENLNAHLNYSKLNAASILGANSKIEVSYGSVEVGNWNEGSLALNYVNDCKIKNVNSIELESNTSDVMISSIAKEGVFEGSFGNLFIDEISDSFKTLDIELENTDAELRIPNSAYDFYFRGEESQLDHSDKLTLNKTSSGVNTIYNGYHKSNSNSKSIHINAHFSNVTLK